MALSAMGGGGMPAAPQGGMINQGGVTPRPVDTGKYDQFSSSGTPTAGGKGGGQPAMPRPTQGQFAPLAPQGGFNVNQAAAGALQQAIAGTQAGMGFQAPRTTAVGLHANYADSAGSTARIRLHASAAAVAGASDWLQL